MKQPSKVLIASPNPEIRNMIRDALHDFECELLLAAETSLAMFLVYKNSPSLIICDAALAQDSSGDLVSHIQNDPNCSSTPLVLISTTSNQPQKEIPIITISGDVQDLQSKLKPYLPN